MGVMNLFKKLFPVPAALPSGFYAFTVKCNRCGEIISGRVNLNNDTSMDYEDEREIYFVRKVLIGEGKCFQQIKVELKFDANKQLLEKQIHGGKFVEENR